MRQIDDALKCLRVLGLLTFRHSIKLHVGKLFDIEKVGIDRRHESTVLVAEDDDIAVDAVLGEHVEITLPIGFIVETLFKQSSLHRVG